MIAVDWSGRAAGEERHIRAASVHDGGPVELSGGRDRRATAAWLVAQAAATPDLVVGLDFSFSFPEWFFAHRGLSDVGELWALAATEGEDWLARCEPPFWGRRRAYRPPGLVGLRRTEEQCPPVHGIGPKSVFQIGGAGSVGTGSIRGMPHLAALRAGGFSVWPFDPMVPPCVIEIYPRTLTGPVVKSSPPARRRALAPRAVPGPVARAASASEDAFDAVVSALVMWERRLELWSLEACAGPGRGGHDSRTRLEGAMWIPAVCPAPLS